MDVDRKLGPQAYYGKVDSSEERSAIDGLVTFRDRSFSKQKDSQLNSKRISQSMIGKESQKGKDHSLELNNYYSTVLENNKASEKKEMSVKNRKRVSFSLEQPHK